MFKLNDSCTYYLYIRAEPTVTIYCNFHKYFYSFSFFFCIENERTQKKTLKQKVTINLKKKIDK